VGGCVERRRASPDVGTVGGDGLLHEAAGDRRVGDPAALVLVQPASRFARDVSQRVPGSGRPGTVVREGEADGSSREEEREQR